MTINCGLGAISSEVERSIDIAEAVGALPTSPTIKYLFLNLSFGKYVYLLN